MLPPASDERTATGPGTVEALFLQDAVAARVVAIPGARNLRDMGGYPTTEQGLQALVARPSGAAAWNGPYLKNDQGPLLDPWNRPYLYRSPSTRPGHDYDLCSRGPNAQGSDSASSEGMICN